MKPIKPALQVRIILQSPPAGVDYGIQKGSGNNYEAIEKQRSTGADLTFNFEINLKSADPLLPDFSGACVHGPINERFIYIDIGKAAGQLLSPWSRRLKIPLKNISTNTPEWLADVSKVIMVTMVAGTAKDGGPNCATVKPFDGWQILWK